MLQVKFHPNTDNKQLASIDRVSGYTEFKNKQLASIDRVSGYTEF